MEEEFYFEETGNKRKYIILFLIVVICVVSSLFLYQKYKFRIKTKITYEVGTKLSNDVKKYVSNTILDESKYKLIIDDDIALENGIITKTGEYTFKVKYNGKAKKGKIVVKDTKAPVVETTSLTVGVNEEFEPEEFISVCEEYSKPCKVEYKNEKDEELIKNAGTYKVDIIVSDVYDNSIEKEVELIVKKGYSREKEKTSDLKAFRVSPDYNDWDGLLVINYAKAFDSMDFDNDRLEYLYNMAESDLEEYLPSKYAGQTIKDTEIIYVYNKYNYIVGFAARALLDNGKYVYLTNGE